MVPGYYPCSVTTDVSTETGLRVLGSWLNTTCVLLGVGLGPRPSSCPVVPSGGSFTKFAELLLLVGLTFEGVLICTTRPSLPLGPRSRVPSDRPVRHVTPRVPYPSGGGWGDVAGVPDSVSPRTVVSRTWTLLPGTGRPVRTVSRLL